MKKSDLLDLVCWNTPSRAPLTKKEQVAEVVKEACIMSRKHWSEVLYCHLCGKTFRSMVAEARHRHNAAYLCKGYPKDETRSDK